MMDTLTSTRSILATICRHHMLFVFLLLLFWGMVGIYFARAFTWLMAENDTFAHLGKVTN